MKDDKADLSGAWLASCCCWATESRKKPEMKEPTKNVRFEPPTLLPLPPSSFDVRKSYMSDSYNSSSSSSTVSPNVSPFEEAGKLMFEENEAWAAAAVEAAITAKAAAANAASTAKAAAIAAATAPAAAVDAAIAAQQVWLAKKIDDASLSSPESPREFPAPAP